MEAKKLTDSFKTTLHNNSIIVPHTLRTMWEKASQEQEDDEAYFIVQNPRRTKEQELPSADRAKLSSAKNSFRELAPITPKFADLSALTIIIGFLVYSFVVAFSALGYGIPVHKYLNGKAHLASKGFGGAIFIMFVLYMLDAEYWDVSYFCP